MAYDINDNEVNSIPKSDETGPNGVGSITGKGLGLE